MTADVVVEVFSSVIIAKVVTWTVVNNVVVVVVVVFVVVFTSIVVILVAVVVLLCFNLACVDGVFLVNLIIVGTVLLVDDIVVTVDVSGVTVVVRKLDIVWVCVVFSLTVRCITVFYKKNGASVSPLYQNISNNTNYSHLFIFHNYLCHF